MLAHDPDHQRVATLVASFDRTTGAALPDPGDRLHRAAAAPGWTGRAFGLIDEPVFTIAGLWRETGDARCFAMLGCLSKTPFPIMPVVIAPRDRDTWLTAPWETVTPLLAPCAPARLRIGLPDPATAFYAEGGHDQLWAPAMATGR